MHDEIDDAEDGVGSPTAEPAPAVPAEAAPVEAAVHNLPAEAAPAVPVVQAPELNVMSNFLALQLIYGRAQMTVNFGTW